jgi:hypothetical protein
MYLLHSPWKLGESILKLCKCLGEIYSKNNDVSSFVAMFELNLARLSKIRKEYLYVFLHYYLVGFPHNVLCVAMRAYMTNTYT